MSAFLLRFKAHYLQKNACLSQFFFVDLNSPCKDLLSPHGPNLAQKPFYFAGAVILKIFFFCYFREEAGDTTMKEEITEVRKYLDCSFIAMKIKTQKYDGE